MGGFINTDRLTVKYPALVQSDPGSMTRASAAPVSGALSAACPDVPGMALPLSRV
jgi:hypothetical protein